LLVHTHHSIAFVERCIVAALVGIYIYDSFGIYTRLFWYLYTALLVYTYRAYVGLFWYICTGRIVGLTHFLIAPFECGIVATVNCSEGAGCGGSGGVVFVFLLEMCVHGHGTKD